MLSNIDEIALQYINQKSHYRNGLVGNPFAARSCSKFISGIVDGGHDPRIVLNYKGRINKHITQKVKRYKHKFTWKTGLEKITKNLEKVMLLNIALLVVAFIWLRK